MRFLIGLLLVAQVSFAQIGRVVEGDQFPGIDNKKNYVLNPDARLNTRTITTSLATVTRTTSSPLFDNADFTLDSTNSGALITWATRQIEPGVTNQNCEFSFTYVGGNDNWTAVVRSGTNTIASRVVGNAGTGAARMTLNTPCTATSLTVGFTTTAVPGATLRVDNLYYGLATNIGTVSQASLYGTLVFGTCGLWSTTSTTYVDLVSSGCTYTATGGISAPTTANRPGFTASNLPPGNYMVVASGFSIRSNGNVSQGIQARLTDGTINGNGIAQFSGTNIGQQNINGTIVSTFTYTSPQSLVDMRIQAFSTSGNTVSLEVNTASGLRFDVYRFPLQSEAGFRPDTIAWKVDANISGANPSLGTATVGAYTGITNPSLTLVNNPGAGNIAAQIPCAGTTAPSGTTCTVDESVGVSFQLPRAGDVLACASFGWQGATGAGGFLETAFQLVETANNAQTPLQEGKSKLPISVAAASSSNSDTLRVCGNFSFASAGQKTLRLTYEQAATAVVSTSQIFADANASVGQRDIHWEVYPINQVSPAPFVSQAWTHPDQFVGQLLYVKFGGATLWTSACTSTPCTIWDTNAPGTVVTRSATGDYLVTFPTGLNTQRLTCSHSVGNVPAGPNAGAQTATGLNTISIVARRSSSEAAHDVSVDLICGGRR